MTVDLHFCFSSYWSNACSWGLMTSHGVYFYCLVLPVLRRVSIVLKQRYIIHWSLWRFGGIVFLLCHVRIHFTPAMLPCAPNRKLRSAAFSTIPRRLLSYQNTLQYVCLMFLQWRFSGAGLTLPTQLRCVWQIARCCAVWSFLSRPSSKTSSTMVSILFSTVYFMTDFTFCAVTSSFSLHWIFVRRHSSSTCSSSFAAAAASPVSGCFVHSTPLRMPISVYLRSPLSSQSQMMGRARLVMQIFGSPFMEPRWDSSHSGSSFSLASSTIFQTRLLVDNSSLRAHV